MLFEPGYGAWDLEYAGMIQTLAESGYVVLSFDPQGQGLSDVQPAPQFCKPGAWQRPQEGGIREHGSCAGVVGPLVFPPNHTVPTLPSPVPDVGFQLDAELHLTKPGDFSGIYEQFRPNFVFGALDALKWAQGGANPARSVMDVEHLGIIGHSAGSDGALVTAGVDPQHRFKAAVALDDYGIPPSRWRPTVPTMIQQTELQGSYGPYTSRPPADWFPSSDLYKRFAAAKTPRALLALAGSDHNDFSYLPEQLADPTLLGVLASRYGERTSTYYARAWLDRFLKADRLGGGRVIGSTFDAIIDPLSRGQGSYDVVRQQNVPYRLKGLRASDQLSP